MAGKLNALEESLILKPITMSGIETLGILDEIQALVSDHLQVVSYKWLSRNFLVSSNTAKRLLEEFVEKHGSGLEVVYALSGWLKSSPPSYNIRLVSGPKLAEVKQEFDGNCSVQVYSVQASIPKDPAALWNAEFVQAEELFKQPSLDNCLRDNSPKVQGSHSCLKVILQVKRISVPPPQQNKIQQSSPKVGPLSPNVVKDVKAESNSTGVHDQAKPSAAKEKLNPLPASKKKSQNDKSSSGTGGSLANFWGRASTKAKPVQKHKYLFVKQQRTAVVMMMLQDVNFRRAASGEGNRKRKVVLDLSDEDEYEDALVISLFSLPVTEVVWEGEETEIKRANSSETTKTADSNPTKKADSNTVTNNSTRPPPAKKSPALGSTAPSNPGSKAGTKKGGNQKDPKQGNILSFFKKV
ncbi:hypothetical protein Patl1_04900 [Pistacia atlantica]|uniref:Uncharacterized protein n=1 Tax=Pistacia atlantica TaxID=434234 RepID=A0ACC1BPL7_9ROSI|nr:hypothetical protein Patl1_04900 [Pistacia atlantica]